MLNLVYNHFWGDRFVTLELSFRSLVFGTPVPVPFVELKHRIIPAPVTNFVICNPGTVNGKFMIRFGKI